LLHRSNETEDIAVEDLMTFDKVLGLIEEFEASCKDEQLSQVLAERLKESRLGKILTELAGRVNLHDEQIAILEEEFLTLRSSNAITQQYSGPHPLSAVRVPEPEEARRICILSQANTVTTSKVPPMLRGEESKKIHSLKRAAEPIDRKNEEAKD
jgi:hypothetical protein